MQRNEKDLTFFERALEEENDPERRRLILIQIRDIKVEILNRIREEQARVRRENELFKEALDKCEGAKKK